MEENQHKPNGGNGKGNNRRYRGHRPPKDNYTPPYAPEVLATPLAGLGLGEHTLRILEAARITTVGDVVRRRANEMYRVQNFGKRNLVELGRALVAIGVDFRPAAQPTEGQNAAKPSSQPQSAPTAPKQEKPAPNASRPPKGTSPSPNAGNNGAPQGKKQKNKPQFDPNLTLDKIFPKPKYVRSKRIEPETDCYVKFQRGGKWGFKDKNGQEVIPPIYDEVFNFKEDMACVERKQLFGYINRENELVIPYRFECASSFSEGYACVGDENKCGFINKQGDVVVPFVYDACTAVVDGRSHVKKDGKWGTLDMVSGEITWS